MNGVGRRQAPQHTRKKRKNPKQPQALPSRVRNIAHHPHPQEILRQNAKIRKNCEGRRRVATGGA
jgi:hypothetical protein